MPKYQQYQNVILILGLYQYHRHRHLHPHHYHRPNSCAHQGPLSAGRNALKVCWLRMEKPGMECIEVWAESSVEFREKLGRVSFAQARRERTEKFFPGPKTFGAPPSRKNTEKCAPCRPSFFLTSNMHKIHFRQPRTPPWGDYDASPNLLVGW